jgi:hypothetical protein
MPPLAFGDGRLREALRFLRDARGAARALGQERLESGARGIDAADLRQQTLELALVVLERVQVLLPVVSSSMCFQPSSSVASALRACASGWMSSRRSACVNWNCANS